jgi:hypothetical protein
VPSSGRGPGDALRQGGRTPRFGDLHQHRQIDAGNNVHFDRFGPGSINQRHREIAGGGSEQVGDDDDPCPGVGFGDGVRYGSTPFVWVVVGADAHGGKICLDAGHSLERSPQFHSQLPVANQDETDHSCRPKLS